MRARAQGTKPRRNLLLIQARINEGLTANDLARRAGLSGNTVRAAEAGYYVDERSQGAIASALGKRPLDFFPLERQRLPKVEPSRGVIR